MRAKKFLALACAVALAACNNQSNTAAKSDPGAQRPGASQSAPNSASDPAADDWTSNNRTLTAERYVPFDQINKTNVASLKTICVYDLDLDTSFQTGPLVIGRILYGTTEKEIFAIDAGTCQEKWRVRESIPSGLTQPVNRGFAYWNGRLFRGVQDGRVIAYDAATGMKVWETRVADPAIGEGLPAAPIAWNGMIFIGNAGSDRYGVRGRMYGLDAASGKIVWETYLVPTDKPQPGNEKMQALARGTWNVAKGIPITGGGTWTTYSLDPQTGLLYIPVGNPAPDFVKDMRRGDNLFTDSILVLDAKTGIYRVHYSLVPADYHDWDQAAAAALVTTRAGKHVMAAAPKDGMLYVYDRGTHQRLYATPITRRDNADAPLTKDGTHFCPGSQGGTEWNGPAFSPDTNLFYDGTVDWCVTVALADPSRLADNKIGDTYTGGQAPNLFGRRDLNWAGWVMAVDADTGLVKWRYRTTAPVLSGILPTKGGLVFAGDIGGHAFAFDADNGNVLWRTELPGGAGGGLVSYMVDGKQRIAIIAGTRAPIFPVATASAKVVVFGL